MSQSIKKFYWLPKCTTCQKAKAVLEAAGIDIKETVDVKTNAVPKDVIKHLADKVGGVENLFSKRALKYRGMGLHLKKLSDDDMLNLMAEEYTFIRRPVIETASGQVYAAPSKKQLEVLTAR